MTFDRLIRKSQGQFLLILASDDILLPRSIATRLTFFSDTKILAIFGDAIPIDSNGNQIGKSAISELGAKSSLVALEDSRTLLGELIFRWNVYGSVLMSRRDALLKSDGSSVLNLNIYCEDMQLYYKLASQNALKFVNTPVAKYRVHDASASKTVGNLQKLHESTYRAQINALEDIKGIFRFVLVMQAFTFHRWDKGIRKYLAFPFVVFAYTSIHITRNIYDIFRKRILKQTS